MNRSVLLLPVPADRCGDAGIGSRPQRLPSHKDAAEFAWTDLFMGADLMAANRLQTASGTVKALRAGLEVTKRKRVGAHLGPEPAAVLRSAWDHCGLVRC
jgi:hypothetical protein